MKASLIVHGGAWDIPDEAVEACTAGCKRALAAGWWVVGGGLWVVAQVGVSCVRAALFFKFGETKPTNAVFGLVKHSDSEYRRGTGAGWRGAGKWREMQGRENAGRRER